MHCPVLYHTVSGVQSVLCLRGIWLVSAGVGARRTIPRNVILVWSKLVGLDVNENANATRCRIHTSASQS